MEITNSTASALRPVQEAGRSEEAANSFQIGVMKKAQQTQEAAIMTLLQGAAKATGIGQNVDTTA